MFWMLYCTKQMNKQSIRKYFRIRRLRVIAKADWMAQKIGKGSGAFHLLISQRCNPGKKKKKKDSLTFDVPMQMDSNQ